MAHYLFNFSDGDRARAAVLLRQRMWAVGHGDRHSDALAPGDHALIYLPPLDSVFIGCVELATAVQDWTPSEVEAFPGDSPSGVLLARVEEWDPGVPMDAVVRRIDPSGSNPYVQENAAAGFRSDVVAITADEYEAALALGREPAGYDLSGMHLNNEEIEVACDALWLVKQRGVEDEIQSRLWERLQPIRTGDYGGSAETELEPDERAAVIRALRFGSDVVALDGDENELLVRLTDDDAS